MDGLEFGRELTAMAFSIESYGRFGGRGRSGQRSPAAILRGWKPRDPSPPPSFGLRLVREAELWFARFVDWRDRALTSRLSR